MDFYVLSDPEGKCLTGTLLNGPAARQASQRGVALIPVDKDIYQVRSAIAGFFRADYGDGLPLPVFASPIAHLTLALDPRPCQIHWRACVKLVEPRDPSGSLRLTADSSQYGTSVGIQSDAVDLAAYRGIERPFVVGGSSTLPNPPAGIVGFALWGLGLAKLLWVAVSQTIPRQAGPNADEMAKDQARWTSQQPDLPRDAQGNVIQPPGGEWFSVTPSK